ncbi:MAG: sulfur oxidation c-type cytochrome SoxX [Paracoccaceae bacterium]|nr:sulfur oxidation c-type cytochrome SoxX [Paracoccaceae bacterium]
MKIAWFFTVAGIAAGGMAAAQEVAPAEVPFDESGAVAVSLSGAAGNPEEGLKVFTTRSMGNCVACHSVSALLDSVPFHGNVGPSLDGVAGRWNEAELRGIVANAKNVYDGTIMPAFYKTSGYIRPGEAFTMKPATEPLPPLLTAQQIEDLVAYLMTLKE